MTIKIIYLMSILLLMTGCYLRDGCLVTPQQVNCYHKNDYTAIQAYQKKESIGHTDVEQRKKDVLECGVRNYNGGNLDGNTRYPGMVSEDVTPRRISIYNCMEKKGYIIHSYTYCMNQGKSTGFCN